jgi:hypothetical protein
MTPVIAIKNRAPAHADGDSSRTAPLKAVGMQARHRDTALLNGKLISMDDGGTLTAIKLRGSNNREVPMDSPWSPVSRILCAVLVAARREAGLTQRQVAALTKRPRSWIAKIEIGERRVFLDDSYAISQAVRVHPEELLRRVELQLEETDWLNAVMPSQLPGAKK